MQNYTPNDIISSRFKALSDTFRRFLLGLIYAEGPLYQTDILKNVKIKSNKLAYHLGLLYDAGLIDRDYERSGIRYIKYSITEDGKNFLRSIKVSKKLDEYVRVTDDVSIKVTKAGTKKAKSGRQILA